MGMPFKPINGSRCEAINDIIESVALEQAALANILDAEGDKIKKFVEYDTCPDVIFKVNKSAESMVNSITRLELVLQAKLALFSDCLCKECEDKKHKDHDLL